MKRLALTLTIVALAGVPGPRSSRSASSIGIRQRHHHSWPERAERLGERVEDDSRRPATPV
jgi:hypothetical protein